MALAGVIGVTLIIIWAQSSKIDRLNKDVGSAKIAIETLLDVNVDNLVTIAALEEGLRSCIDQRRSAQNLAEQASRNADRKTREALNEQDKREDEIERIISDSPEPIPNAIPPRIAKLLSEAACSANRGKECN